MSKGHTGVPAVPRVPSELCPSCRAEHLQPSLAEGCLPVCLLLCPQGDPGCGTGRVLSGLLGLCPSQTRCQLELLQGNPSNTISRVPHAQRELLHLLSCSVPSCELQEMEVVRSKAWVSLVPILCQEKGAHGDLGHCPILASQQPGWARGD